MDGGTLTTDSLKDRVIRFGDNTVTVTANNATTISFASTTLKAVADDSLVYGDEGGVDDAAVYGSIALGKDAFGVLDPEGEGMELIIKDKAVIGGPLEQFSTIGYKFNHGAGILYQERLLRVETGSSYSYEDEAN